MINLLITLMLINGISGKIQGIVKDQDSKEPISYADVILLDTEIGAATDENGNFYILNVPPGIYTVEISYIGYQSKWIKGVKVEVDQTVRLNAELLQTAIEISPIIVTSKIPAVKKDMVGTTYIVRKTELAVMPIDYSTELIAFQPAVAHTDTAIYVRGGRATEVQYMIDNVSIIDPQTGDPAINVSKGIIDEIIFLPGAFDAEYGRAMSGVINLITEHPSDDFGVKVYGKTERIMPFYYDFGYENAQSSIHLPISKKFKGLISLDLMHTDDWNPKLYKLPHKQRDDYSLYGKWIFAPSGKMRFRLSGAKSRMQFDRYKTKWRYNLDHYRSDMRKGDLQALNVSYLPDSRKLFNLTLSRLYTKRIYGVREQEEYGLSNDFVFRDYNTLRWPLGGTKNPFGVYIPYMPLDGDYYEYQEKSSQIWKANLITTLQIHKYHEIKAGVEYTYQDFQNLTYFLSSDTLNPIKDEYQYYPIEYSAFLQDNIDYKGLYAKIGCRYDYFSSDIGGIKSGMIISPRFGISFKVTDKFLFRTNVGRYAQPPLYDYMYGYYSIWPFPSYIIGMKNIPPIGNPELEPEKTTSYEIGLQGEIQDNLVLTVNTFYKDVSDLIGTRIIEDVPTRYVKYFNVEYANITGIEAVLDFSYSIFTGKVSYTLSWARGTSSYAEEVYYQYYYDQSDTTIALPAEEYYLDFDQRNRIFAQGVISFPLQSELHFFSYFGDGFPYTPPGPEGKTTQRNTLKTEFQQQIDCVLSKSFKIGKLSFNASFEIINLLDQRYEIAPHYPMIPVESVKKEDFVNYMSIYTPYGANNTYYSPAADFNHDGLITPAEEYLAYRDFAAASDDWVNAYTAPRRARFGISLSFQ